MAGREAGTVGECSVAGGGGGGAMVVVGGRLVGDGDDVIDDGK